MRRRIVQGRIARRRIARARIARCARNRRADGQHVVEGPLGDDQVARRIGVRGHDDRQAPADEVVRDLVDLRVAGGDQALAGAGGHDGLVQRVLDAGLEGRVQVRQSQDFLRRLSVGIERLAQLDHALGQRAGLVGAEHVDGTEVLDRLEPAHDDPARGHRARPVGQRHADDRRQQFRGQSDGQRDREHQRVDDRPMQQQVDGQHEQHHHDHDLQQQVTEAAHAPRELGLGLAGLDACGDRAVHGVAPGAGDQHRCRAAAHRRAQKDRVRPRALARVDGQHARALLDRERLAGQAGLDHQEVAGVDHDAVGRHEVPGRQQHEVARHDRRRRHRLGTAVALHANGQRQSLAQRRDRRGGTPLLPEPQQRAGDDDHDDDRRVDPVRQHQRHDRAEDQDQHQRTGQLPRQQAQRLPLGVLGQQVGAHPREPRGGLGLGQPIRPGIEPCQQCVGRQRPMRRRGVRVHRVRATARRCA